MIKSLRPETIAFLLSLVDNCETANADLRQAVANDRLCYILPVVETSESLCAKLRSIIEGAE